MEYPIIFQAVLWLTAIGFLISVRTTKKDDEDTVASPVNYKESLRPQYHFTPEKNWLNDPNGLVYHDGKYHLFYQYNPFGDNWGNLSWGHAVSEDLLHWDHMPIALEEENGIMMFSGSIVVDEENSSDLGTAENPPMIAIYTGHYTNGDEEEPTQDQRVAYSLDDGQHWTKYEGNPVIDEDLRDFRDPRIIQTEDSDGWIMVVALPTEHKIRFYRSSNLLDWEFESEFGPAGATKGIWECPDLFKLPVEGTDGEERWVLQVDINSGPMDGEFGGQYFVGHFDGSEFVEHPDTKGDILWVDEGKDFYAAQSYSNAPDDRRIWIAWMNNWEYAREIPTAPWRGMMTCPREVGLMNTTDGPRIYQQPVKEHEKLRKTHQEFQDIKISNEELSNEKLKGKAFELKAEFELDDAEYFGIKVRKGSDEETVVGYDTDQLKMFIDRELSGKTSFNSSFTEVQEVSLEPQNNRITMQILVDWSSVEVFGNEGQLSMTNQIFPSESSDQIEVFAEGGTVQLVSLDFWQLQSVWNESDELMVMSA